MYEDGIVTLVKIVSVLVGAMAAVPLLFLAAPSGDRSEPEDFFDTD